MAWELAKAEARHLFSNLYANIQDQRLHKVSEHSITKSCLDVYEALILKLRRAYHVVC